MVRRCREKGVDALVRAVKHLEMPAASFDAVYAMNCLLHVPEADLPAVLREVRTVMPPGGRFYEGEWGGELEEEGIRAGDDRFFARRSDEQVFMAVRDAFEVVDFHTVEDGGHHFQSLTAVRPLD